MEKLGVSKDIDGLIKALKYPKWYIRRDAAKWIGELKETKAANSLIQLLKDEDCYVRDNSKDSLVNMGSNVVELLISYLKDENNRIRGNVASALGLIGDKRAIEPLISLLDDDHELVKIKVSYALKNLGWEPSNKRLEMIPKLPTKPLVKPKLKHPIPSKKKKDSRAKIKIKGKTIEILLPYLKDDDKNVRLKAIKALKKIKDEKVVDLLIQSLKDKDSDIKYEAVKVLGKIKNPKAVNPLTKLLWDEFLSVQQQVLKVLGAIGDAKAVDPIIQALKDNAIYTNGFETIEKIGKSAIKPLIKFLRDDDYWIRHYTAETLEKIGWKPANETEKAHHLIAKDDYKGWEEIIKLGDFALEPLIQSLSYEKLPRFGDIIFPDDRAKALSKLGEIAFESLIKVLKEGNSNTRRCVAEALMFIRDVRALEPLAQALNDENSDVRHKAIGAFSHYSDEKVIDVYIKYNVFEHKDNRVRRSAMRDIGWREDYRLVEPLLQALKEDNWGIIDAAVHSLSKLKEKRAVEPLIQLLKHKDSMIKRKAVVGLGDIGDIRAVEPIIQMLKDEDWQNRQDAANALGKIGDKKAVEPLIQLLEDEDKFVRLAAVEALTNIGDFIAIDPIYETIKKEKVNYIVEAMEKALEELRKKI
ncbi:MAG: HEAT repeat domain-containing protein [Candidatus Helarchaeota archaeon]|nr:HEAT repeat domain-containing protein [Candidatus Helarchaeota archaeon]